ncbi:hypothetical protein JB92DRAFT_724969 [Gautieria morchelliformis]|nr:hypothetical protein JB92DRAFT_724969 [Gautieria morchelliformis]
MPLLRSLKLDTLPNDVLIRVFKALDACDIRRCSLTCRVFHKTIRDSMLLQYRLELAVARLEEGGTDFRLSIAERLARLRTIERGWAKFFFRQKVTITSMPGGTTWLLRGGVLAHRSAIAMGSVLSFIQLPSAIRRTRVHTWQSDMRVNILQFAIDPAQDLVALVACPQTPAGQPHTFLIHLRTMSTGARHPCAAEPVLSCVPAPLNRQSFRIQIMGEFLAALYRTPEIYLKNILYIWNWKTGQLLIVRFAFPSCAEVFKNVRCISNPYLFPQPELVVYDFIAARPEGSMEPRLVRIYQLPCISPNTASRTFIPGSEPPPELPTSFYPTSCSRLLTIIMHFTYNPEEARDCYYLLFVHASSLLEVDARSNAEQLTVPWENWGPLKTRIMPIRDYQAFSHVYGTRYVQKQVVAVKIGSSWEERYRLRMLDFNPLAVRRALSSKDASLSPRENEHITIVQDSQPTILDERKSAFTERVTTALPYREVIGWQIHRHPEIMIDRECLVYVWRNEARVLFIPLELLLTQVSQGGTIKFEFLCI